VSKYDEGFKIPAEDGPDGRRFEILKA